MTQERSAKANLGNQKSTVVGKIKRLQSLQEHRPDITGQESSPFAASVS